MSVNVRKETASGAKWLLLQKCTLQPVQFIYGALLAHLVTPHEIGILGLTAIFFAVAAQLKDAGFGSALIRKQDRTEQDCSTVFWFNVGMSLLLSLCLFLAAPWFAKFYNEPALVDLTRISAAMMLLNSTTSVHWSLYSARRDFKTPAVVGMITTFISMPFCLWAAYAGWSYWAVFMQSIISGLLSLIIVWIISPWKPKCMFSIKSFMDFFSYGSKLVAAGLVWTTYSESRTFVIGKFYSPAQLALYSRAHHMCYLAPHMVNGVLGGVTFPILSTLQGDKEKLNSVYRKYIRLTALLTLWPMLLLASNSESFIYCVYGENWLPAAYYARIICYGAILDPIAYVAVQMFLVTGRSDLSLKREIWFRSLAFSAVIIGAIHSVAGICYALVAMSAFNAWISSFFINKCTGISQREQLRDIVPYTIIAVLSVIPCVLINLLPLSPFLLLPLSLVFSATIFISILYIRKDDVTLQILHTVKDTKLVKFIFKNKHCDTI
ncbi:MAG: lipopolysaccharide biosynthesis protein [Akkermansia sp.]|nr:lipopolysaccharide biosynthesis protein [Akkermansia sp.]